MKYRKKPIVIEAFEMTKDRGNNNSEWPVWLHQAWQKEPDEEGSLHLKQGVPDRTFEIKTLEGNHLVTWGDFIIQGVSGELYPCKPDIFEKTYQPADESPSAPSDRAGVDQEQEGNQEGVRQAAAQLYPPDRHRPIYLTRSSFRHSQREAFIAGAAWQSSQKGDAVELESAMENMILGNGKEAYQTLAESINKSKSSPSPDAGEEANKEEK